MSQELDLVLERTLDAPIGLVWKAYTDPDHLKRWFAPSASWRASRTSRSAANRGRRAAVRGTSRRRGAVPPG